MADSGTVVACVEATDFEQLCLWQEWTSRHNPKGWTQETGAWVQVGTLNDNPVTVMLSYAMLNGTRVVFWDAVSQVVDFDMVKSWLHSEFPNAVFVDAMNFHNARVG